MTVDRRGGEKGEMGKAESGGKPEGGQHNARRRQNMATGTKYFQKVFHFVSFRPSEPIIRSETRFCDAQDGARQSQIAPKWPKSVPRHAAATLALSPLPLLMRRKPGP